MALFSISIFYLVAQFYNIFSFDLICIHYVPYKFKLLGLNLYIFLPNLNFKNFSVDPIKILFFLHLLLNFVSLVVITFCQFCQILSLDWIFYVSCLFLYALWKFFYLFHRLLYYFYCLVNFVIFFNHFFMLVAVLSQ